VGSGIAGSSVPGTFRQQATLNGNFAGQFLTATATDASGNTSEFSNAFLYTPTTFLVTTTADSGPGSFRQALLDAHTAGDVIRFQIPGGGAQTINPRSVLTTVSAGVTIDATTEGGYSGTPLIRLDGASAGSGVAGLYLSGNNTVKGLAVTRYTYGIVAL